MVNNVFSWPADASYTDNSFTDIYDQVYPLSSNELYPICPGHTTSLLTGYSHSRILNNLAEFHDSVIVGTYKYHVRRDEIYSGHTPHLSTNLSRIQLACSRNYHVRIIIEAMISRLCAELNEV